MEVQPVDAEGEDNYWPSLPVEIIHIILCCGYSDSSNDPTRKRAFEAHSFICRLVCRLWRDVLPPVPKGFALSFAPAVAVQGSISLLQWAKEMVSPRAWSGSFKATTVAAVKGKITEKLINMGARRKSIVNAPR